jgi:hypothetical protein
MWTFVLLWLTQAWLPAGSGAAVAAEAKHYPVAITSSDQSLQGMWSSLQSYVQIPRYWKVDNATVRLDYKASQLAIEGRSSVTLLMNGTPFHSFRPVRQGDRPTSLSVAVPLDLLTAGSNLLTIQGALRTGDDEEGCLSEDNRDNWLHILKSSAADIQYAELPLEPSIRSFYERFAGMDAATLDRRVVVVPDDAEAAELETAARIIAGLSKASETKDDPIPLMSYSDAEWRKRPYAVIVASRDRLPGELIAGLGGAGSGDEALIRLASQGGASSALIVTAEKPELLARAGRLLANADLSLQLNGEEKVVTAESEVATPPVSVNGTFRLTDTGDTLLGMHHQTRTYFVSLPANRSIAEASKIRLDFRYARNLDFDRSMVTLLVDGRPIGSKKLSPDWADNDSLTLPIPRNANISGNFSVTAAFDLELINGSCARNGQEMPWAFVGADSEVQLNTLDRTELILENYPYPFLRDGVFHKVAVVLPEEKDRYALGAVSNLFSLLGQYAEGNAGELRFFEAGDSPDAYRDYNVIAIGGYGDNELIRSANPDLYFPFGGDGRTFVSNEKKTLDPGYGSRLGMLQLLESPLGGGNGLLAITGSTSEYAFLASKLLSSEGVRWKVWGDAVLADADGKVEAYRFKRAEAGEPSWTIGDISEREDVLQFLTAAALVLVLVILSLLLIARKYRKKRGGDRET